MKKYTLLSFALLFSIMFTFAQATKTTIVNTPMTRAFTVDGINYTESNKEENIAIEEKEVLISGNGNKLNLTGTITKILITGKDNDITIESVNEIIITGNSNFVSWEKTSNTSAKPIITDKGGYNNIGKRSGNAFDKADD